MEEDNLDGGGTMGSGGRAGGTLTTSGGRDGGDAQGGAGHATLPGLSQ